MRLKKAIVMAAIMGALLLAVRLNGDLSGYVTEMKSGRTMDTFGASILSGNEDQALRLRIEEEAAKRRIAPIDARVDRVWKAIPGYNGLEVDVNKTYMHMRKAPPHAPIQYIFNEIKPKVGLDDLGMEPIYKGNPEKPMAALMINVAWGNEFLEPMLKTLKQENVKATFFFDGSWLKNNADAARVIQSYGHELSNHAYSHPDMSKLDRTSQYNQIARTEALLKTTLGVSNRFFAPPSGDFNRMTVEVAAEQGLKTVLWTLDTVDWMHPSPDSIVRKVRTRVEPGSLILMHPTDSSSGALLGIIKAIKQKGLVLGTVSETLSSDRVKLVEAGL